ncbi:response regulator transcription factor [Cellulomonas sp. URHE0023]|uniref:response regulator transcription factor n=1 Tax=Cellulomonas sp. URHE0023 TaxID=1380354 RepID=UPI0004829AE6|nr:response regulator transcription factor [Cellulomonas sp. URHE0023]
MRITVAEDSTLLREGLVQLLVAEGHTVVDAVGNATELRYSVARDQPDLVLVDVRMPPDFVDEGIRAALEIRHRWPHVAVLVLSQHVERRHAAELLAGEGGGVGYLLKDRVSDIAGFLDAVDRVGHGGTAFDQEVVRQLVRADAPRRSRLSQLSGRELAVLSLVAQGYSNASVAAQLFVSQSAVEKHMNTIFTKLDIPPDEHRNRRVLAVLELVREA